MADQLSPTFTLKRLPPGVAHGALMSEPSFADRGRKPVSAEFDADGEASSPCISYEDYARMNTYRRAVARNRQLTTPSWAVNASAFREILTRFMERRAGIRKPGAGSLLERLNEAQRRLLASIPKKIEVLDRLMREYQAVKDTDPARATMLQSQIQNLDTSIRLTKMGPGAIARMATLYYSVGFDSVGVASEIGCSPMLVRQTLFRLHRLAKNPTRRCGCGAALTGSRIKCHDCVGPVYRAVLKKKESEDRTA